MPHTEARRGGSVRDHSSAVSGTTQRRRQQTSALPGKGFGRRHNSSLQSAERQDRTEQLRIIASNQPTCLIYFKARK
ncbi:hypothetical protein Y1Q_0001256 [Alligator mississippiensis]|uniref:Uncharacterized protein n=1 Tax=Alligator mississippiensis TaxID=8496 RepID=A0A151M8U4_ALLMI|nr:hypothetical protein Y1Q_0001256 [Alligator mississippiensis]